MTPFAFAVTVFGAILLIPSLYLLLLTVAGLFPRPTWRLSTPARTRFGILVPAHNEEILLPRLLASLRRLEYPRDLIAIHVVADNCTDGTAEAGRRAGASVHERRDLSLRGKGHALQWLLGRIRASGKQYDAFVFLDADCMVSSNFLAVMDRRLQAGERVVQGYYTVANAFESPVSTLRYLAMTLMHYVRPAGRQALRLSCGLFGTGMAFRREVLDTYDWDAYTLAEDVEYYMKLTDRGIRVDFAAEAVVSSEMPARLREAQSQNLRWEKGRLQMARKYVPRFLLQGITGMKPMKIDAAIQQALPPLSITLPAAFLLLVLAPFTGSPPAIAIAAAVNIALLGHVVIGLASARVPLKTYRVLAYAPFFVAWKLTVYLRALRPAQTQWVRTERPRE